MGDTDKPPIEIVTDEGMTAYHAPPPDYPFLAAPTAADDFNVLGLDLIPIACLSLTDLVFQFDSSFVTPDAAKLLSRLKPLRESRKNKFGQLPPLSIFGHADPSGSDDYNKELSGRRAKAVYGLVLHKVSVWSDLYGTPYGGDDWSQKNAKETMCEATGLPASTARSKLIDAYMTVLCPDSVQKSDFLAQGASAYGKGDYQGCSDFNPLLLLTEEDQDTLPKEERNARNRANRRVVIYLFRPGSKVTASLWPCPTADAGASGCRARFFSDGDQRRKPGAVPREHQAAQGTADDTFACRFYSRIGGTSPCEQPVPSRYIRVRLFDPFTKKTDGAPCRVTVGEQVFKTKSDGDGFINVRVTGNPEDCLIEWKEGEEKGTYQYSTRIFLKLEGVEDDEEVKRRLHNLGYAYPNPLDENVRTFQRDFGYAPTGDPQHVKQKLRDWHDDPTQIKERPEADAPPIKPPFL